MGGFATLLPAAAGPYDDEIAAIREQIVEEESKITGVESSIVEVESEIVAEEDRIVAEEDRIVGYHVDLEAIVVAIAEIEELIVSLAQDGNSTAIIGTILRDQHAVPDVRLVTGERISQTLARNGISLRYPEDMMNLMRRALSLIDHLAGNR